MARKIDYTLPDDVYNEIAGADSQVWQSTDRSSWIASVMYDITTSTLTVMFNDGRGCTWDDRPINDYYALIGASSVGKMFYALGLYGSHTSKI